VAVNYKIPLLVWGENSQFEYGGPASERDNSTLNKGWLEQFQMLGYRVADLVHHGLGLTDLKPFIYPTDEEINEVGITGLYLGYYTRWDGRRNMERMKALGWHTNPDGPIEGTYADYENLDCKWVGGLHDFLKFVKYGYGRATDNASIDIRHGRLSRLEGFKLAKRWEAKIPWKYLPDFLRFIDCTEEQFFQTINRFTNPTLFRRDAQGRFLRNEDGELIKLEYGFEEDD